ncbi:unnamed protein product [Dicrocoelium dendriticum]|nr:unnamed protein product [Dicrocoelium dendriticum]
MLINCANEVIACGGLSTSPCRYNAKIRANDLAARLFSQQGYVSNSCQRSRDHVFHQAYCPHNMSHESAKPLLEDEEVTKNAYNIFVSMESLNEKLKLLNYERGFCRARHQKPLTRHYFAIPTNPGEQFHTFTTLSAWLIGKANGKIDPPQEYDDPNAIVATILDAVRELGHKVIFPPSKLKVGWGECCIDVLQMLAKSALQVQSHRYELPVYPTETEGEVEGDEVDSCSGADDEICEWQGQSPTGLRATNRGIGSALDRLHVEDELDEDDDEVPDIEAIHTRGIRSPSSSQLGEPIGFSPLPDEKLGSKSTVAVENTQSGVLECTVDPSDWQLEVERVLPQLRIALRSDSKDWRAHLEEMRRYQTEISTAYTDVKQHLTRLQSELGRTLDKIQTREKYMNSQVEPLLSQYRAVEDELSETNMKYRQLSGGITERSRALAELTEELERVKCDMDECGSSMTDGSPVVRIKQAIQKLKAEMVAMEIRTGVLEHILLRTHLRLREDSQKPLFSKPMDANVVGASTFIY